MNKLAFAAVAAFALTAASAAFADDQIVQVGHGATVVVSDNQGSSNAVAGADQLIPVGHGAQVLAHADQANSPAGNLTGVAQLIQVGHGAVVVASAGKPVISNGGTELVRNNQVAPSQTVISLGRGVYTNTNG